MEDQLICDWRLEPICEENLCKENVHEGPNLENVPKEVNMHNQEGSCKENTCEGNVYDVLFPEEIVHDGSVSDYK